MKSEEEVKNKKIYQDRKWLHQKYWVEGWSMNRMAEEAGCSKMAISRALRKHGIRARTQAEGMVYRLALGEIAFSRFKIKAGQQVSDFESNLKYFLEIKKKIERGEKLDAEEKASLDDLIEEADRSEH